MKYLKYLKYIAVAGVILTALGSAISAFMTDIEGVIKDNGDVAKSDK